MPTKYPKTTQTGETGVALARKLVTDAGGIFRPFESPDVGIDGAIELLNESREPSGDLVLFQVKAGDSYVRNGRFYVDADKNHFETWTRYAIPVAGVVCNPETGEARWVDISDHLRKDPEAVVNGPYSIEAPESFSVATFPAFADHFKRQAVNATRVDVTPNLLIRAWQPQDAKPTRAILSPIASDYPDFDSWLKKKFSDPKASKKVAVVDHAIAAFSMWQSKDSRNIKLQTFMVGQSYRGTALGQHFLYHEIRTWAADPNVDRVHVTVSSAKSELIDYFRHFGFRVEGFSPRRYQRPAAELIMAKHFVRRVVASLTDLDGFAQDLHQRIWGLSPSSESRFGVHQEDLAVPASFPALEMILDRQDKTVAGRILLQDVLGREVLRYDDESLMREFLPLRIHLPGKRYVVVPIYPAWVMAMLSTTGPHSPLKLRLDNVYYCYPKVSDLRTGDLVVFYETKTGGGKGAVRGSAVVQETVIDVPSALFQRFSQFGIYKLEDIEGHRNSAGKAMAIKFSLFEPFQNMVPLKDVQRYAGNQATMQGLTPISHQVFECVRTQGLT